MQTTIKQIRTKLAEAQAHLNQSTGGESVCALHKRGEVSQPLKYYEGLAYVLGEAVRHLEADSADVAAFLQTQTSKYQQILDSPVLSSPDWQAYAQGGLAAVEVVRES